MIINSSLVTSVIFLQSREHISAQSSVRYELLGSPDQYIIVSAMSESHYNFVPYSEEAGKLTTVSR